MKLTRKKKSEAKLEEAVVIPKESISSEEVDVGPILTDIKKDILGKKINHAAKLQADILRLQNEINRVCAKEVMQMAVDQKVLDKLQEELLGDAKEYQITSFITPENHSMIIEPKNSNKIDAKSFLKMAVDQKKVDAFWECVNVGITLAKKYFGERQLLDDGCMKRETEKFAKIKIQ
jgi:hypothetical protein